MSIEKRLNYKFKYELKTSKSLLLFISPERVNITGQTRMFFLMVLSCYCFYIFPPWLDKQWLLNGDGGLQHLGNQMLFPIGLLWHSFSWSPSFISIIKYDVDFRLLFFIPFFSILPINSSIWLWSILVATVLINFQKLFHYPNFYNWSFLL